MPDRIGQREGDRYPARQFRVARLPVRRLGTPVIGQCGEPLLVLGAVAVHLLHHLVGGFEEFAGLLAQLVHRLGLLVGNGIAHGFVLRRHGGIEQVVQLLRPLQLLFQTLQLLLILEGDDNGRLPLARSQQHPRGQQQDGHHQVGDHRDADGLPVIENPFAELPAGFLPERHTDFGRRTGRQAPLHLFFLVMFFFRKGIHTDSSDDGPARQAAPQRTEHKFHIGRLGFQSVYRQKYGFFQKINTFAIKN